MIVAETSTAYQFVTQPDHARLAGQFAERWGNDGFERPEPYPSVVAAAHTHDDGWEPYDRRPHLGDDGSPVGFTELPAATWIELYDRGIEAVAGFDPYAGLLVSLHGTGLRRRRFGLSPSWPDTPTAFETFVEREQDRQRDLLDALTAAAAVRLAPADGALLESLHATGTPPEGTTSRLWTNYALLQAWDSLSLACCTTVAPPASDGLEAVPRGPTRPDATLGFDRLEDGTIGVDPYPFEADPLVVRVAARTVAKDAVVDERSLVEAYFAAGYEVRTFELRPAG